MERARAVVINEVHPKDSKDGKVDSMASDVKHIQKMREGIRNHASKHTARKGRPDRQIAKGRGDEARGRMSTTRAAAICRSGQEGTHDQEDAGNNQDQCKQEENGGYASLSSQGTSVRI